MHTTPVSYSLMFTSDFCELFETCIYFTDWTTACLIRLVDRANNHKHFVLWSSYQVPAKRFQSLVSRYGILKESIRHFASHSAAGATGDQWNSFPSDIWEHCTWSFLIPCLLSSRRVAELRRVKSDYIVIYVRIKCWRALHVLLR